MGMLVTTTLWFTPKCLIPNNSGVVDTAMHVIAPVHAPITAVLMYNERLLWLSKRKNDPAIGAIKIVIDAVLDIT